MEGLISDAVLVQRAEHGDADAFERLYQRHAPSVARVCRRWLRDPSAVDDAVQETFLKAWRALSGCRVDAASGVGPWLRQIARNYCHDVWRAESRVELSGADVNSAETVDPASTHLDRDCADRLALQSVLQNLGGRDAALLVQRHIGDAPVGDMAREWGLTRASMDVALHRARVRAPRLASAEGLRSLLPVGLLRRLTAFFQRLGDVPSEMAAVLGGVAQVVVVASLALQPLQPAYADSADRHPSTGQVTLARARAAETLAATGTPDRSPRARPDKVSARQPSHGTAGTNATAAAPTVRSAATHEQRPAASMIRYESVEVPGTRSRVEPRPPAGPPNRRAGIDAGVTEVEVEQFEDEPEALRPASKTACETADLADPVVYCDE